MKRLLLAFLLFAAPAFGQTVTFQPTHPGQTQPQCDFEYGVMYACVDWVDPGAGVVAGWAEDHNTGSAPQSITLWKVINGSLVQVPTTRVIVQRPDVAAFLGAANQFLGDGLIANAPLDVGTYAVLVADVPYSQYCGYDPNNGLWCGYIPSEIVFTIR